MRIRAADTKKMMATWRGAITISPHGVLLVFSGNALARPTMQLLFLYLKENNFRRARPG
ncbi:MAG: hypothetical protein P4L36_02630 [Holophaga sp.]|nr:hypothetical protein [Holophaga sp.]